MAGPAGALDRLLDLLDLLERIWALLDATTPPGSYLLEGVCDVDANGSPVVVEVPYAGGPTLSRIESKLNAMAGLLQAHKNLKQPICTFRNPQGNVTVTFKEIL